MESMKPPGIEKKGYRGKYLIPTIEVVGGSVDIFRLINHFKHSRIPGDRWNQSRTWNFTKWTSRLTGHYLRNKYDEIFPGKIFGEDFFKKFKEGLLFWEKARVLGALVRIILCFKHEESNKKMASGHDPFSASLIPDEVSVVRFLRTLGQLANFSYREQLFKIPDEEKHSAFFKYYHDDKHFRIITWFLSSDGYCAKQSPGYSQHNQRIGFSMNKKFLPPFSFLGHRGHPLSNIGNVNN